MSFNTTIFLFQTTEAAQAGAAAVVDGMMIDHITEMAIVTATDRTVAVAVAAEVAGRLPTVKGTTVGTVAERTVTRSTTIPVGRSHPETAETVVDTAVAAEAAVMTVVVTAETVGTAPQRTIGPYPCRVTIGSSKNCSRAATARRASILTAMRTSRLRPRVPTCPTVLRTSVR